MIITKYNHVLEYIPPKEIPPKINNNKNKKNKKTKKDKKKEETTEFSNPIYIFRPEKLTQKEYFEITK